VAAVIVRRGLDEWSFSLDTGSRGFAFPLELELGPRADAKAARWLAERDRDDGMGRVDLDGGGDEQQ
jgi:hypothetical protein